MTRKTLSNVLAIVGVVLACVISFGGTFLHGAVLSVDVTGLRSSDGVVHVLVYDTPGAFESGSAFDIVGFATQDASDAATITLSGMGPGDYALMVHHDENANDVFELRGDIPLEGWGYSNNVGHVSLPTFEAAKVTFDDQTTSFDITIVYAN